MFTKADIEKYFLGEKQESFLFMGIGIVAVVLALLFFLLLKTNFYKGAAIPLLMVGILLAVIGFAIYKRSDPDRIRNVYAYDMNPGELKQQELPRMRTVMKNFIIYRYTEIALAVAGIIFFFYFRTNTDRQFWAGFGMTLTIMALTALFADYFAEKRGSLYTKGLESFTSEK